MSKTGMIEKDDLADNDFDSQEDAPSSSGSIWSESFRAAERKRFESGDWVKSPVKAIRKFCRECYGNSLDAVINCSSEKCVLLPFRVGQNPFREVRELSEESRKSLAERLSRARIATKQKEDANIIKDIEEKQVVKKVIKKSSITNYPKG